MYFLGIYTLAIYLTMTIFIIWDTQTDVKLKTGAFLMFVAPVIIQSILVILGVD